LSFNFVFLLERERKREREKERKKKREKERKREREKERKREREKERKRETEKQRNREREGDCSINEYLWVCVCVCVFVYFCVLREGGSERHREKELEAYFHESFDLRLLCV
jgi:hypothetical protein